MRGMGWNINFGIIFGGERSIGDQAYQSMIKDDFISAVDEFEEFIDDNPRHIKKLKAQKMLEFCKKQKPYQEFQNGINAYQDYDFGTTVFKASPGIGFGQIALISKNPIRSGSCIASKPNTSLLGIPKTLWIRIHKLLNPIRELVLNEGNFRSESSKHQNFPPAAGQSRKTNIYLLFGGIV